MRLEETAGLLANRRRGLELVKGWTVAAAVGALGLTGLLALVAADTFHGRTISTASTSAAGSTTPQDGSAGQSGGSDLTPQAPSTDTFGGGVQPPAVVSGGS